MEQQYQGALFCESIYDALGAIVQALGGPKKVGPRMQPTKTEEDARTWLLNRLNPDRREKFDPEEIMWLICEGRKAGCHVLINYICESSQYAPPTPIDPEDQRAELQRKFIEATRNLQSMAREIQRLESTPHIKAAA